MIYSAPINGQEIPDSNQYYSETLPEEESEEVVSQYIGFFSPDSASAKKLEKVKFENNLPEEYHRLADQYNDKPPEKRELGWFEKLLKKIFENFPSINLAGFVTFLRIIIYIAVGLIVILLIRFLLFKNIGWANFKKKKSGVQKIEVNEDGQLMTDYEALVRKATTDNDFRLAVRYYYLWLLSKLDASDYIDFHPQKTNSDYLNEIKIQSLKKEFARLSYIYDYIWYGEIPMRESDFNLVRKNFESKIKSI